MGEGPQPGDRGEQRKSGLGLPPIVPLMRHSCPPSKVVSFLCSNQQGLPSNTAARGPPPHRAKGWHRISWPSPSHSLALGGLARLHWRERGCVS